MAIKGKWTEALTTYAEGCRSILDAEHAAGLMRLVQGHPALHQPTIMTLADPLEAEKHYAAGLRWYYDGQYGKAEKEFFTAVEQDGQDARYYYFLGLARLMQGDRDSAEDFEQGARLERQNRPARRRRRAPRWSACRDRRVCSSTTSVIGRGEGAHRPEARARVRSNPSLALRAGNRGVPCFRG